VVYRHRARGQQQVQQRAVKVKGWHVGRGGMGDVIDQQRKEGGCKKIKGLMGRISSLEGGGEWGVVETSSLGDITT
jgi:hypothetical protein